MEVITASKLQSLSVEKSRKFQELLPELVKRLIIDSVSDLSSIRIPDCNDIWAPGFDGIVECEQGSLYVNSGGSVWEFGNVGDSLSKINSDYEKRTNNPLGLDKKETSYYAVIPKIWAFDNKKCSITQWTADKNDWKEVKVYDAVVLCEWINKSPSVAAWLFEKIYEGEHLDFTTASKAWEMFSRKTEPPFSTSLFINGRDNKKRDFYNLLCENEIIKVKSKTSMDSFGFCLASIMASDDLKNSVIVVNDVNTYKKVSEVCKNKIILLKPIEIESFIEGNKTIMCYNNGATVIEPDIFLEPLKKKEYLSALKDMQINENELEDYYYHTHGELFALVRKIPRLSNQYTPKWSSDVDVKLLYPLLFLRNIDIKNEADKHLCEMLTEEKFERLLSKYDDFCKLDDSPIKRIENIYSIVSYEETWNVLSPDVEGSEIKKLTEILLKISDIYSGKEKDEFQVKYRAKRYINNISLNYLYYSYSYSDSDTLKSYIYTILKKFWDTDELLSVLRLYAEAEPEMVMNILEDDYKSNNSHIKEVFGDTGYGSNYVHILSAIDILVYSKKAKIRACNLLCEMCKIKADYFWHSNPIESLLNALWLQNNEGSLTLSEKKKLALKYLEEDDIGIELVFNLLIKNSSIRSVRIGRKKFPTNNINFQEYVETINEIALSLVRKIIEKNQVDYIVKIINCFWHFPLSVIKRLFDVIKESEYELIDKLVISYVVREKLYFNKKYEKTEYPEYVKLFEEFLTEIELRKWDEDELYLFYNNYYDCPILDSPYLNDDYEHYQKEEKYTYKCRINALNKLSNENNNEKISVLISVIPDDLNWGYLIAESDLKKEYVFLTRIIVENKKYHLLSGFLDRIDPKIAYDCIIALAADEQKIILNNANNRELAELLSAEESRVAYWSNKRMLQYSDFDFKQLMKYNPSGLLSYYTVINRRDMFDNKDLILNILSAMIRFKKSLKENTIRERDLIIRFFIEMDAHSYYSDEIAVACLELTKFSHNRRVFECVKKYYFLHPEKICQIINERTDGFFEDYEFEWYYELPKCTFESFDDLKSFIQFIIENVNVDYKSVAYELIGRLLARALDTEITEKNILIFKIVDNYNNKRMDSGFIVGYDSLNLVRTVEDGTDQKRIYDVINNMAENIEIDFPHSALLLQKISKQYLDNSKTDFITSELGFEVL